MEIKENKTCGSCGYYPFCKETEGAIYTCNNNKWIKRDVQMHLKSKNGEKFDFGRIE